MYAVIQRFKIRLGTIEAAALHADEELVPRVKAVPGFLAFYVVDAGNHTVAVFGLFEAQQGADQATQLCREWFRSDWPTFLPVTPELTRGAVLAGAWSARDAATAARQVWPHVERRANGERRLNDDRRSGRPPVRLSTAT